MSDENRASDWTSQQQPGSVWPSSQPMQPAPAMPTPMSGNDMPMGGAKKKTTARKKTTAKKK